MKFTAAMAPELQSDEDLIVLCHGERRVLVPLPDTYEDAERLAIAEFRLAGPILFETNELAECKNLCVRIRPDTWKAASMLSARLFVSEVYDEERGGVDQVNESDDVRLKHQAHQPPASVKSEPQHDDQSVFDKGRGKGKAPARSRIITRQPTIPAEERPSTEPLTPESSTSSVDPSERARPRPATRRTKKTAQRAATAPEVKSEPIDSDEDEDVAMLSAVEWPDVERDVSIKKESEDDDRWLASNEDSDAEAAPLQVAEPSTSRRRCSPSSPSEGQSSPNPKARSTKSKTGPTKLRQRAIHTSCPTPLVTEAGSNGPVIAKPDSPSASEGSFSSKFRIIVKHNEDSQVFMVGSQHTIEKILPTVCRHFQVEDIDRAKLIMRYKQDVGAAFNYQCPLDHTMRCIGACDDSEFTLVLEKN